MNAYEAQLLFLRAVVLLCLYGFVSALGVVAYRELKRTGSGESWHEEPDARLIVLQGGDSDWPAGTVFPIGQLAVLGRDLDADVVIPDGTLSSRHAAMSRRDNAWWLEDLGSTNGTFVNGERLPGEVPAILRSGDVVQVGGVRLRFVAAGA